MHKCVYSSRIRLMGGKLWHIVRAHWKDKAMDVLKVCEDGRMRSRNLYFRQIFGYGVSFPGEKQSLGYGYNYTASETVLEPWGNVSINLDPSSFESCGGRVTEDDRAAILKAVPGFKWILDKHHGMSHSQLVKLAGIFRENPRVELLLDAGFRSIAFNMNFYKLKESKRRQVMEFLKKNQGTDWSLSEVQLMINEGITDEEAKAYYDFKSRHAFKMGYRAYKYVQSQTSGKSFGEVRYFAKHYSDYMAMVRRCKHNVKDPYWACPKNMKKNHDKLMVELQNIQMAEAARRESEEAKKLEKTKKAYARVVKKWIEKALDMESGVRVYVPKTWDDIKAQAEALNQCLISCNYAARVVRGGCVLVFIVKGNKRLATAELLPDGSVGQFYGNEKNRDRCKPSKAARQALDEWKKLYVNAAA